MSQHCPTFFLADENFPLIFAAINLIPMKAIHAIYILFWPMLLAACSQRDLDHVCGNMSANAQLVELQNYYSPYLDSTFQRSLSMVNAIDTAALSRRDRYEWLELKCNISESNQQPCTWIEEIQAWADDADLRGSDRDILAAHLALVYGYKYWDREHYSRYRKISPAEEYDSIRNLRLQELLFCIHYKEDDTISVPRGDYLLLKSRAYYLLAREYHRTYSTDYYAMAECSSRAARLLKPFIDANFFKLGTSKVRYIYKQLLREAATLYRNCGEYKKADRCMFQHLELASEENNEYDICRSKALLASIDLARVITQVIHSGEKEKSEGRKKWLKRNRDDALFILNDAIAKCRKESRQVPSDIYHYKALAFIMNDEVDSAYHYNLKAGVLTTELAQAGSLYISSRYKSLHRDQAGAFEDMRRGFMLLANVYDKVACRQQAVPDFVIRDRIQRILDSQELDHRYRLVRLSLGFAALLAVIIWLLTRKQRKLTRLHRDIEALNRQLDQLRVERLRSAGDEEGSEVVADAPLAETQTMESVFVRKLLMKRAAFMESAQHRIVVKYALSQQSGINPESNAMPADVRRALMDAVLGDFSLECQQLRELYPALTAAETIYCILNLLDFGGKVGAYCMEVSHEAYRRRKSRIKSKVSPALFDCIFASDEN